MSHSLQKIGLLTLTSLVIGNLLGSGVFMLPATLAKFGSISVLGWIITAFGAIILALIFSELAHRIPKNGGPYAFVRHAFGDEAGFYIAWGYWTLSWISNSALVASAVSYIGVFTGQIDKSTALALQIAILGLITGFNLFGLKTTGRAELVITVAKIIPLIVLPVIGIPMLNMEHFPEFNLTLDTSMTALTGVIFITFWGFVGLETGTVPGGQIINARRTIPMATILGTLTAAAIYIAGTVVLFGVIPNEQLVKSETPYALAATAILGGYAWAKVIAVAAIITCVGSLNGWTMVVGRIAQAAADDGLFPSVFSKTNKYGTPWLAVIISSSLTVPFLIMSINDNMIEQFNLIIDVSVMFYLVVYTVCILAFVKTILHSRTHTTYYWALVVLGFAFIGWALLATKIHMLFYSLLSILVAVPIRLVQKMHNRRRLAKTPA